MNKFQLGWNPVHSYDSREKWGLDKKVVDGKEKKLSLPKGIIIPSFAGKIPCKIKIRRSEWKNEDPFGKYYEVPGSSNQIPSFGDLSHSIVVLLESELDSILTVQEAGDLCCCLALGGAQKKPDGTTHQWLQTKKCIFFALDFDGAGKKEFIFWKSHYPNLKAWPIPREKSPGDAYQAGVDLRQWIASGLQYYQFI